jgi:hypothetical protein
MERIDITYSGGRPDWRVEEVIVPEGSTIGATIAKSVSQETGQVKYRLSVTLGKQVVPGPIREHVFLKTNEPGADLLVIPIVGNIEPPLRVSPEFIDAGNVNVGDTPTKRFFVRADRPFKVLRMDWIDGRESERTSENDAELPRCAHVITAQFHTTRVGAFRHEIRITTDYQRAPLLVVISGVGVKKGQ